MICSDCNKSDEVINNTENRRLHMIPPGQLHDPYVIEWRGTVRWLFAALDDLSAALKWSTYSLNKVPTATLGGQNCGDVDDQDQEAVDYISGRPAPCL